MRKAFLILMCLAMTLCTTAFAQETEPAQEANITVKQGFVYSWEDEQVKNLTTFEVAKTKAIESLGKWNILTEGWSIDCGFIYDAGSLDVGAILLGRELGVIGKYIPIDFPLKDRFTITIYPIGIYVKDILDHPEAQGVSGGAILKLSVKF